MRFSTDDYVAIQALVAADLGVAVVPSLAVGPTAHRVHARAPRTRHRSGASPSRCRRTGTATPPSRP